MDNVLHRPIPAVSAVIVQDDKILLVKRGHEPSGGLWSFPGGRVELGETVREALVREVFEETSLVIEPGEPAGVQDVILGDESGISAHYIIISFHASVISGELKAGDDAADAQWVGLGELDNYATTVGLRERLSEIGVLAKDELTA